MRHEPRWTVGSVPYVNAAPLIAAFEGGDAEVRVVADVPSRLPALLQAGVADAIMVSSYHALENPHLQIVDGVGIGSFGPVKSVRLFSKVHFSQIQSLCLDASSMTSNRLAQALLRERWGIAPATMSAEPNLRVMLERADACVMIGDLGMTAPAEGLQVLDLGEAFTKLTGLPFLWAAWVGPQIDPELAAHLVAAPNGYEVGKSADGTVLYEDSGVGKQGALFDAVAARSGWPRDAVADYFLKTMVYRVDPSVKKGFAAFAELLRKHGYLRQNPMPEFVGNLSRLG